MWVVLVCGFLLQVVNDVGFNSVVMIIVCLYGDVCDYCLLFPNCCVPDVASGFNL